MFKISNNKGGALLTLLDSVGIGYAKVKTKDEKSVTLTLKLWRTHLFISLAFI